jgi:hypothetical protein
MPASVQELTDRSGFVFEGAVRRVGATTTPGLKAAPDMAVVHVIRVLKGPSALAGFAGREITVQLHEHETVREGLRAVFFANGLLFGEGLAVREVGRLHRSGPEVEREVEEAIRHAGEEDLLDRLRRAELVVSGVAIETRRHESESEARARMSEHDPDWWECVIEVESVEKGRLKSAEKAKSAARLAVTLFAKSTDLAWYRSPKFEKGSEGIWLMQRLELRGKPVPGLVTTHTLDFQPRSELERIRVLLKRVEG